MIEFLSQPWHWAVSGAMIVFVMFLLLWFGGRFGVSTNLETMCTIAGAGKVSDFFKVDWKKRAWNLVFIAGAVVGGYIAITYLSSPEPVDIAQSTRDYMTTIGIDYPASISEGNGYVPAEVFETPWSVRNLILLVVGGFMVGFGTRYASGCTSGHAISGLSNLQISSLIAVIGFFIGGLLMAWLILPWIMSF
ncbi:MAG: YeeE/YedE family protein [Bacteroidia bacterium]|nr:YeeE/YedE family protein [Bacteroidia bacterium]